MGRIALIGENSVEYVNILIDIWNKGDCAVLIDWRIPLRTAIELMNDANVYMCYIEQGLLKKTNALIPESIECIEYEKASTAAAWLPQETYDKFTENYSSDEAIVIYSSGTTGKSKGIILSHFAINTNADAIIDYMQPCDKDRIYLAKTLSHSSTLTGELLVALKTRMQLFIPPTVVPPRYALKKIAENRITIVCLNPTLLKLYADEYKRDEYTIYTLRAIYVSGSILSDSVYDYVHSVFRGIDIYNVYGLSEAGPRVSAQKKECCKSNSVGKAIKDVEIIIVDENGNSVPTGERGVVHVKSPSRFLGYISGEEKHKSYCDSWQNTGDIGYFDQHEELHIVSRRDDVIFLDSHKIYPSEVEKHIVSLANVAECAVTAIECCGTSIICCAYSAEHEIDHGIKRRLRSVLMPYEIPNLFVRINEIPRTRNGKISTHNVQNLLLDYLNGGETRGH